MKVTPWPINSWNITYYSKTQNHKTFLLRFNFSFVERTVALHLVILNFIRTNIVSVTTTIVFNLIIKQPV